MKIARQLELSQQFCPRLSTEGFRAFAGYALFPKVHELVSFVFHHPVFQAAIFTATDMEIKKLSAKVSKYISLYFLSCGQFSTTCASILLIVKKLSIYFAITGVIV